MVWGWLLCGLHVPSYYDWLLWVCRWVRAGSWHAWLISLAIVVPVCWLTGCLPLLGQEIWRGSSPSQGCLLVVVGKDLLGMGCQFGWLCLQGNAGSGKTVLMSEIASELASASIWPARLKESKKRDTCQKSHSWIKSLQIPGPLTHHL